MPFSLIAFFKGTALFASLIYMQNQGLAIPCVGLGFLASALVTSWCFSAWSCLELVILQPCLNAMLLAMHSFFTMEGELQRRECTSTMILLIHCVALSLRGSLYIEKFGLDASQVCWVLLAQALYWTFAAFLNKRHIRMAFAEVLVAIEEEVEDPPAHPAYATSGFTPQPSVREGLRSRIGRLTSLTSLVPQLGSLEPGCLISP